LPVCRPVLVALTPEWIASVHDAEVLHVLQFESAHPEMGVAHERDLVMGTRCGDLDPGVILYLQQKGGMTIEVVQTLLYEQSGLLGVSGLSSTCLR
jgi:acetate kinase